jgi:hypothetical protein
MRTLRVIFLACLIFALAGSVFAKNDKGNNGNGNGNSGDNGRKGNGQSYSAPEFNFSGSLKYELLILAGGAVLLFERRRRRHRVSLISEAQPADDPQPSGACARDLSTRPFFNRVIEEGPAGPRVENRVGQNKDHRYGYD